MLSVRLPWASSPRSLPALAGFSESRSAEGLSAPSPCRMTFVPSLRRGFAEETFPAVLRRPASGCSSGLRACCRLTTVLATT